MSKVPEMLDSLWDRMLTELERRLPASALDSWLRPCRLAASLAYSSFMMNTDLSSVSLERFVSDARRAETT